MRIFKQTNYFLIALLFLFSCTDDVNYIPKPNAYLRINFPERSYHKVEDHCPYILELPSYMTAKPANDKNKETCHKDISLGKFNGVILFTYLDVDTALSAYINHSIQRVQEHQIIASSINDTTFLIPQHKVYGAFFEIKGNAASPFQFFLTDSINHFVKGEVFFNVAPNYDSIFPVLQYIKPDLYHLIETLEWK